MSDPGASVVHKNGRNTLALEALLRCEQGLQSIIGALVISPLLGDTRRKHVRLAPDTAGLSMCTIRPLRCPLTKCHAQRIGGCGRHAMARRRANYRGLLYKFTASRCPGLSGCVPAAFQFAVYNYRAPLLKTTCRGPTPLLRIITCLSAGICSTRVL